MDLSALIFVALAVAWAVYLVPKALRHHEAGEASRGVESFSDRLRVLGRRGPVEEVEGHVVRPGQPAASARPVRRGPSPAARRRRVLGLVLLGLAVVVVLAATGVLAWGWIAVPLVVLVAWLVACRLMVRHEHATPSVVEPSSVVEPDERQRVRALRDGSSLASSGTIETPAPEREAEAEGDAGATPNDLTDEIAQVPVELDPETGAPVAWDPVPVTLPTYVGKEPAARRAQQAIDLDSTGVWTSGRSEADSALAREADESARAVRAARRERDAAEVAERRRASGD